MRSLFFFGCFSIISATTYGQSEGLKPVSAPDSNYVRTSKSHTELFYTNAMFKSNELPLDLPMRSEFKSDEVYKKVIQGYINTHSDIIVQQEALRLGYKFDFQNVDSEENTRINRHKRQIPLTEEEVEPKKLK